MKRTKSQRGSITLLVIITVLFFILIVVGVYVANSNTRVSQMQEIDRIKEVYEADVKNIDAVYAEKVGSLEVEPEQKEYTYSYTGDVQTFTVPVTGYYKIEAWGAQGNNPASNRSVGGQGGYTKGEIQLQEGQQLYIYVGEHRTDGTASFNCGSIGGNATDASNGGQINGYGGGGATDIRTVSGTWSDFNSLKSRIMVAAGGGGASDYAYPANGGYGGGVIGGSGNNGKYPNIGVANVPPTGGTQNAGGATSKLSASGAAGTPGSFGKGGNGETQWGGGGRRRLLRRWRSRIYQ